MADQTSGAPASSPAAAPEHRGWFIFIGIVLIVVGAAAIAFPFVTTLAAKIVLGWLFLIGGVAQVIHGFSTQKWSAFFLSLIIGLLYVFVGGWLAFFPFTGIITLTIMLAALFIVEGVIEIGMAFRVGSVGGWIWFLISGIIGILAGILIMAGLPSTATWAIGLIVGINLIFSGVSYMFLPSTAPA
jgi:uncharacterized membrane protein HdeD (DUF308 family)